MPFRIDDKKQLEKYKAIRTEIENLKHVKLNTLPVYDGRYIKTKIRTFGDKVYTNFRGSNVPEDDIECESFTEDLKNVKLNALPVYDDRYIKTKIRTFGHKVYANFRGSNVPEDDMECESFTAISIDSLVVYDKKYYLQVYFVSIFSTSILCCISIELI